MSNQLLNDLQRALSVLDQLDFTSPQGHAELLELQKRLRSGEFRLAVLGQFKRGKSTLINALLGDALLPADVIPVTAIPTFIRHAPEVSARVIFKGETDNLDFSPSSEADLPAWLRDYVSESGNPHNQRQVERVEIGHPAPLLESGVVLIDTPGIGSTHSHNTEVAYRILPQCDAALFLVSPDPPLTAVELEYLREICQSLPRTFFLLNKIDILNDDEQTAAIGFLANQLQPLLEEAPQILTLSARHGLRARSAGDDAGWRQSGLEQVERNLIDFLAREKQQTLETSLRCRYHDQLEQICMQLELTLNALLLPEQELRQRIAEFRQALPDIEREKLAADDMLGGDLKRLEQNLHGRVEEIRSRAKQELGSQVERLIQEQPDNEELERQVRAALSHAMPQFFAPEMRQLSSWVEQQATGLLNAHQRRSNDLIESVRKVAADLFAIPYRVADAEQSYLKFKSADWSSELFISDMDPWGQKLSRKFFSSRFRHRRTVKRLREESRKLWNQNVEQISWALRRNLEESFRHFGAELSGQLEKTVTATRMAMELALEKSENRATETTDRQQQLRQVLAELRSLQPGPIN